MPESVENPSTRLDAQARRLIWTAMHEATTVRLEANDLRRALVEHHPEACSDRFRAELVLPRQSRPFGLVVMGFAPSVTIVLQRAQQVAEARGTGETDSITIPDLVQAFDAFSAPVEAVISWRPTGRGLTMPPLARLFDDAAEGRAIAAVLNRWLAVAPDGVDAEGEFARQIADVEQDLLPVAARFI